MRRRCRPLVALGAVAGLLGGCAIPHPRPIYYWGHYEAFLYEDYSAPGKKSPAEQIELLNADLEKAKAQKLPAPPGLHAQLGYLYLKSGKSEIGLRELQLEKLLFPESAAFIDSLLARAKPAAQP